MVIYTSNASYVQSAQASIFCHTLTLFSGRAFQYKKQISDYIAQEPELMEFDLTAVDWQAIELISRWLYLFREATTQMSATQHNTLASVHGIFIGLQEEVKRQLLNLPITTPPELRKALLSAYCKLSDYFFMIDQSPFYLWACRMFLPCSALSVC